MTKKSFLIFFSFFLFFVATIVAQEDKTREVDLTKDSAFIKEFFSIPKDVAKTSGIPYAIKDGKVLLMDVYQSKTVTKPQPVVIYLFGGAFRGGNRDNEYGTFFCSRLAQRGITAISIDYRLGWRGRFKAGFSESNAISELRDIIQDPELVNFAFDIAVEDAFSATNYIIENAEALNIDPTKIMLSGSSAGALTSLRSEFFLKNKHASSKILPEGFKYSGILSFAGAIYLEKGFPYFKETPAPIFFVHGDQDLIVRYRGARLGKEGIYSTKALVKYFRTQPNFNYQALIINRAGHEDGCHKAVARNFEDAYTFIQDYVLGGKQGKEERVVKYEKATTPYGIKVYGDEDVLVNAVFNALLKR